MPSPCTLIRGAKIRGTGTGKDAWTMYTFSVSKQKRKRKHINGGKGGGEKKKKKNVLEGREHHSISLSQTTPREREGIGKPAVNKRDKKKIKGIFNGKWERGK